MTSTPDREANLRAARRLALRAADEGADLVAFPENFSYLREEGSPPEFRDPLDGDLVRQVAELAREIRCHILAGSIPERIPRSRKIHNTSLLLDPRGEIVGIYRKLHLFDIGITGKVSFRESGSVTPGGRVVAVDTALGRLGLTICYDLRFPELYRRLCLDGARVVFVPAAFTAYTGRYHWLALLRARAIENQCYIVAPAQVGRHTPRRRSYGHTAIFDPWGDLIALRERGAGVVTATIDMDRLDAVRRGLPALKHVRSGLLPPHEL